jgi:hypothetical protein
MNEITDSKNGKLKIFFNFIVFNIEPDKAQVMALINAPNS